MTDLLDQGAAATRAGRTSACDVAEAAIARIVAPRLHDRRLLAMAQRAETALA